MIEIFAGCANLLLKCWEWFMQLINSVGGFGLWFCAVLVSVAFKFIFGPVFGHAQSDFASKSYNAIKRRKEK